MRAVLACILLFALPAQARLLGAEASAAGDEPACVELANGDVRCTAAGAQSIATEIHNLRQLLAVSRAATAYAQEVAAADAREAEARQVAANVRTVALEALLARPQPVPWGWLGAGVAAGAVAVLVLIVVAR